MKKLILLISICLLSQNYTIASENGESHYGSSTPLSQTADSVNLLRTQNSYSASLLKPKNTAESNNDALNKSNLKFPGLKLTEPQETTEKTVENTVEKAVAENTKQSELKTEKEVVEAVSAKVEETVKAVTESISQEQPQAPLSILKSVEQQYETPVRSVKKETALNKSDLKFPGLKLPETVEENTTSTTAQKPLEAAEQQTQKAVEDIQRAEEVVKGAVAETVEQTTAQTVEKAVSESATAETTAENKQLTPEEILRSQTQLPVKAARKTKTIPQKYRLNPTSIVVEKREVKEETKNENEPVTITVNKVEFPESKIFSPDELQGLAAPLLGRPITLEDIQKVISDINRCYTLGDYPTAKAYLPPQRITDGVLKISLLEGTIGKINVEGNRWVRTSYFKKRIANNQEGELLNIDDLEKDIIKFNNNNTAKVRASLSAGENQGESDITLNVTERFPFKLAVMTDNQGRKSIGTGRFGSMLSTDSVLGVGDKFVLGGYLGRGNRIGFSDYNMPIGRFGTRLGASAAASNISVVNGPMRKFDVGGTSQAYSVYITQPLYDSESANISSYTSVNFKKSTSDIMDIKFYDKSTLSLTQGFNARKDTERGIWYTGHFGSVGFKTSHDNDNFFKYEGNITRLHDFGKGIVGQFRVSGQYSPDNNLPWMEQFQVGGMSTVRGYSEALLLGKSGYFASAEIMTPLPILPKRIGSDKLGYIYPRDMIKGAVFMDNGMIFPYKYGESIDSGELLMSWGFGLRVNLKEDLAARFYWGYGLHNRYEQDYKMGRFHFDITCAPDIGRLVDGRHPVKKEKKPKKHKKEETQIQENL